nr:peptidase inhibitor family I36 protein [Actinophytocola sp.]
MRSALDGVCQSGEFCLYYNSGHQGSLADFVLGVRDFSTVRFVGPGAGKGQVKNNAASACNKDDDLTARVHLNSNWQGAYDTIPPNTCRNLVNTYNENASFVWIAGAGQLGEHRAAGDDRRAGPGGRLQPAHLVGVGGVVEDQQHPAVGQERPVERRPGVQAVGHGRAGDAERVQHLGQQHRGVAWFDGGAGEVEVDLAVGKVRGGPPRRVQRERRLADARAAGDHRHRRRRVRPPVGQQRGERVEGVLAAGEVGHVGGQLARRPRAARRRAVGCGPGRGRR